MASGDVASNIWQALPREVVVLDGLAVGRGRQAGERHGGGQELQCPAQDPGVDGGVHAHRQVRAVLLDRRHLAQCAAGRGWGERAVPQAPFVCLTGARLANTRVMLHPP